MIADDPDGEGRQQAGDEADQEYLQRECAAQLGQQHGAGIDPDHCHEHQQAHVFEDVARRAGRIAEKAQA
ncbi:hypothetical protein D3C84_1213020 [compost metagenome]